MGRSLEESVLVPAWGTDSSNKQNQLQRTESFQLSRKTGNKCGAWPARREHRGPCPGWGSSVDMTTWESELSG